MKPKIYIASPYTIGDVAVNVRRQMDAADKLMDAGLVPFVPLYSHFQHMVHPRPYDEWLAIDLEWLKVCDAILRLPGESKGADREVLMAEQRMKPVFHDTDELINHYKQSQ